jgi:outer membrane lipoprotein carrier protein
MFFFKMIIFYSMIILSLNANDFKNITTFEANFTQTITNLSGNKVSYAGVLHIQEPNLIRWQYIKPIKKFVYIKKNIITIIEPELEQAIVTQFDKEINILNLLKTSQKISNEIYISTFNNRKYTLTLNNKLLEKISYKDALENTINIYFKNIKQNHTIHKNIFIFYIPSYYDIIKK